MPVNGPAGQAPGAGPVWRSLFRRRPVTPRQFSSCQTGTNTFEGGSSGTTVTTGNSGGASGNAFDVVTIGSGATVAYDNANGAAHGLLACHIATNGTSAAAAVAWQTPTTGGPAPTLFIREALFFTANPSAAARVCRFVQGGTSGTLCGLVAVNAAGTLSILNSANTSVATTVSTIPLGTWFRIEAYLSGHATAGAAELRLYKQLESTVADEVIAVTGQSFTGMADSVSFGVPTTTTVFSYWIDDVGVSTCGYLGPATAPAVFRPSGHPARAPFPGPFIPGRATWRTGPYGGTGAPFYPLHHPATAPRPGPFLSGRCTSRAGPYGQAGPPFTPLRHPAVAPRPGPFRPGRAAWRAGPYGQLGPPFTPLHHPAVAPARPGPFLPGRCTSRAGPYQGTGAAARPLHWPARIRPVLPPPGRVSGRTGTLTVIVVIIVPGCVSVTNKNASPVTLSNQAAGSVAVADRNPSPVTLSNTAPKAVLANATVGTVTVRNQACPRTST